MLDPVQAELAAAEHRRLLVEHGREALLAATVAVLFLAVTTLPHVSGARRVAFIVVTGVVLGVHAVFVVLDARAPATARPWSGWPLATLHGLGWAVIVAVVWPPGREHQLLLLAFVTAWCAAVALASAPFVGHAAVVMAPPVAVTCVEFLRTGRAQDVTIAAGLAVYAVATITLHAQASRSLLRAITLQIEHDARSRVLGELVLTDPLTGIGNRRALLARLESELSRGAVHPTSLALLDLDRFKLVNDRHGHGAGDDVLTRFAGMVTAHLASTELVARTGGEEFAVLLPGVDRADAVQRLDRLRRAVARDLSAFGDPVTVSIGVHELQPGDTLMQALECADIALYQAKRAGRNRVASSA